MQPFIRAMSPADRLAVTRILQHTPEFKAVEVQVAEELIDAYLDDPLRSGYRVLVSEVDSRVTGYVCYGPTPLTTGTWDVYWIAVARGQQGKGHGKALLGAAEADVKQSGGRIILIETSAKANYLAAQRLYSSQGYAMVSRIPDFYEPGDDRLTYMKRVG